MTTDFINDEFLLENDYARELYHDSAAKMPIIDYHCHLIPKEIATNHQFKDLTEVWLGGDHYKWRALRGNGISEEYITGSKPSWEKFEKWAETVPYTMRNPLYHWTHLELARVFGIFKLLNPETAREIYEDCTAKLQTDGFKGQEIMKKFNVETVCTTDDPIDNLEWHKYIQEHPFGVNVLPTWRPDKVTVIEKPDEFCSYIHKLEEASGISITGYQDLLDALQKRHDYFESMGCRLSDHGLDTFYAEECTNEDADRIFRNTLKGIEPDNEEIGTYRTAVLLDLARMGFLRIVPRKGAYVAEYVKSATPETLASIMSYDSALLDRSLFKDLMDLRILIERECTRLACANLTSESLALLQAHTDAIYAADDEKAPEAVYLYHKCLTEISQNVAYSMVFQSFEKMIRNLIREHYKSREEFTSSIPKFQMLTAAISRRDAYAADIVLLSLLGQASDYLGNHLEQYHG